MPAFVTDQFRILNTNNFINSISTGSDTYYIFVGLPNSDKPGFGRNTNWEGSDNLVNASDGVLPNPVDNFNYLSHYGDTILYGKKITSQNIRRCIRKIDWVQGRKYDMYRHDYDADHPSSVTNKSRLYDSNYYVINSQYQVYICISNGSSGDNPSGNASQDEPLFTDLEPSKAGNSGDGYIWKYLFTVPPTDIIKFDSTEFIPLPNDWDTSSLSQIKSVRENGNSTLNNNQIKFVYIENAGNSYSTGEVDILGDGTGGKVFIETEEGKIIKTTVTVGGSGYTYALVDLGPLQISDTISSPAKLIPIIPPSKGHGYDLYREMGADKVLIYSRFDDSSKDFPVDTKFAQIGILKNPLKFVSDDFYTSDRFSALSSLKVIPTTNTSPIIGEKITQTFSNGQKASGYIASYDKDTKVLKYFKDRSLYYNPFEYDQTDYVGISSTGNANVDFSSSSSPPPVISTSGFTCTIDSSFTQSVVTVQNKVINLDVSFNAGIANPEINKTSGDIIYIDNRPLVQRNSRQKEDIKIILEF